MIIVRNLDLWDGLWYIGSAMVEIQETLQAEIQLSGVEYLAQMVGVIVNARFEREDWRELMGRSRTLRELSQQLFSIPEEQKEELRDAYRALQEVDFQVTRTVYSAVKKAGGGTKTRTNELLGLIGLKTNAILLKPHKEVVLAL